MSEPIRDDDPRLTAYVLGELDPTERTEIEAAIESHPDTEAAVAELRDTIGLVTHALSCEPVPLLSDAQRTAITTAAASGPRSAPATPARQPRPFRTSIAVALSLSAVVALALLLVLPPLREADDSHGQSRLAGETPTSVALRDESQAMRTVAEPRRRLDVNGELAPKFEESPRPQSGERQFVGGQYFRQPGQQQPIAERPDEVFNFNAGRAAGPPPPHGQQQPLDDLGRTADSSRPQDRPRVRGETLRKSVAGRMLPQSGEATTRRFWSDVAPASPGADSSPTIVGLLSPGAFAPDLDVGFRQGSFDIRNEAYNPILENEFITPTGQAALSTFSIDVDTASYSNVRRFLTYGQLPPADAVRIEELLNYFRYDYPEPEGGAPFSVTTEIGVCPWNAEHRLARIGLKGRDIPRDERPPSNLVFLVDVSGSMAGPTRLPLVQQGLEMLVGELTEDDRVAIVTYAGEAGLRLPSTTGDRRDEILSVIRGLRAGGSTNGAAGIQLAYAEAVRNFLPEGTNRVILCTDGDFNVGVSDDNELVRLIQDQARRSRVFLSIFGFGMGNIKDARLEQLANKGNGHYGYVDSPREARKVFVEELAGTLYTIAKDVKIQVEFNPVRVGAYRLIGYENRVLAARDFHDDTKDAGEIGAGHTVTALYEIIPADKLPAAEGEPLKYQPQPAAPAPPADAPPTDEASPESFTVKLRYKQPHEDHSTLIEFAVVDHSERSASPSRDFEWAASVAAFGLVLRNSAFKGQADLDLVRELAAGAVGTDESGLRREFLELVDAARRLVAGQPHGSTPER